MSERDHRLLIKKKGGSFLQRIVQCASKIPVVLYDTIEKRGCLVPACDAILHMAMTKLSRTPHNVNGNLVIPNFADPARHGFEAPCKCSLENLSLKLIDKLDGSDLADKDYFFKDLVLELWSCVEILSQRGVEQASVPGETIRGTMRDILRGWEFRDLVDDVQTMQQNEVVIDKTSGGWVNLIKDIGDAVVFFATGLEDMIKPSNTKGLCHIWRTVPKGRDYLAAGVPMLSMLYERAGSQLTRERITRKGLMLHQPSELFEDCRQGRAFQCDCVRLQQLFYDSPTIFGGIQSPRPPDERGAIIIGSEGHFFRPNITRIKHPESMYSQANVQLGREEDGKNLQPSEFGSFGSSQGIVMNDDEDYSPPGSQESATTAPISGEVGASSSAGLRPRIGKEEGKESYVHPRKRERSEENLCHMVRRQDDTMTQG